jgi:hypothetical protein
MPVIARQEVRHMAIIFVAAMVLMEVIVIARALSRRSFGMLRGNWG